VPATSNKRGTVPSECDENTRRQAALSRAIAAEWPQAAPSQRPIPALGPSAGAHAAPSQRPVPAPGPSAGAPRRPIPALRPDAPGPKPAGVAPLACQAWPILPLVAAGAGVDRSELRSSSRNFRRSPTWPPPARPSASMSGVSTPHKRARPTFVPVASKRSRRGRPTWSSCRATRRTCDGTGTPRAGRCGTAGDPATSTGTVATFARWCNDKST